MNITTLIKKYEDRLKELNTQKVVIEKETEWTTQLLDTLRKELSKTEKIAEIRPEAESNEFRDLEAAEAALIILREVFPNEIHQKELAREMFRRGWQCSSKTPDQSVATALLRLKESNHSVEKTGRGKFRLVKELKEENHGHKQKESKSERIGTF